MDGKLKTLCVLQGLTLLILLPNLVLAQFIGSLLPCNTPGSYTTADLELTLFSAKTSFVEENSPIQVYYVVSNCGPGKAKYKLAVNAYDENNQVITGTEILGPEIEEGISDWPSYVAPSDIPPPIEGPFEEPKIINISTTGFADR